MKRSAFGLLAILFFSLFSVSTVHAVEAGLTPDAAGIDTNHLEGWITGVNYQKNYFRLLNGRGFQRHVTTKPGTIGDYRLGDKVRVEIDPGYKRANTIEKIY